MYIKTKLAAITTTIVLATAFSAPSQAALETASDTQTESIDTTTASTHIEAPVTETIAFAKPEVTTTPAPEPVIEEVIEETVAPLPVKTPAPVVAPAPTQPKVAPVQAAPAPAPAPVAVAPSGRGQAIVAAAKRQLGVGQDCTRLVSNSLAAVGINFHGWPHEYFSLGTQVSAAEAQPGDLIYYSYGVAGVPTSMAHIAIYTGNGMAVHGGWNGNQTVEFSANVGSGPVFIRLR